MKLKYNQANYTASLSIDRAWRMQQSGPPFRSRTKTTIIKNRQSCPSAGLSPCQPAHANREKASYNANSLWRSGSRSFFKDQRAMKIGDILTVIVEITDKATINNKTKSDRASNRGVGIDKLGGLEVIAKKILPSGGDPANLVGYNSTSTSEGSGLGQPQRETGHQNSRHRHAKTTQWQSGH